jgi:hypothetical protein
MTQASDQALINAWGANQPDESNEEQNWRCDNLVVLTLLILQHKQNILPFYPMGLFNK